LKDHLCGDSNSSSRLRSRRTANLDYTAFIVRSEECELSRIYRPFRTICGACYLAQHELQKIHGVRLREDLFTSPQHSQKDYGSRCGSPNINSKRHHLPRYHLSHQIQTSLDEFTLTAPRPKEPQKQESKTNLMQFSPLSKLKTSPLNISAALFQSTNSGCSHVRRLSFLPARKSPLLSLPSPRHIHYTHTSHTLPDPLFNYLRSLRRRPSARQVRTCYPHRSSTPCASTLAQAPKHLRMLLEIMRNSVSGVGAVERAEGGAEVSVLDETSFADGKYGSDI
jgi:hypothetical protein